MARFPQKGVPPKFRSRIWNFLMLDKLKMNKSFFRAIYLKTIRNEEFRDQVATFDLRRLFSFANKTTHFKQMIQEAEVLLNMFAVSLPVLQIGY